MQINKKFLTGIIIAVISFIVAALRVVSVILFGKKNIDGGVTDTSVSVGYNKYSDRVPPGASVPPAVLTPYFCAYRFETNVYEANAVNCKFSYAISKGIFKECYENMLWSCRGEDTITEYNIYLLIENTKSAADLNYLRYHQEPEFAQQLKEYEVGAVQNGVYVHEKIEFQDLNSFPFKRYSVSSDWNDKEQLVREFAHTEEMNLPEQLFIDDSGCIKIMLVDCVTYASGKVSYTEDAENAYFHYLKEGNQVKISKTKFN